MPALLRPAFTIETRLTPAQVQARLQSAVEAKRWLRFSRAHAPFEGAFDGARFDVQRIIHHRNSFLPQVRGAIEPAAGGTRLVGTMRLHAAVMAFMALWFSGVLFASVISVRQFLGHERFETAGLIPIAMLVFGIVLVLAGFVPETRKALRELARVVDASRADLH